MAKKFIASSLVVIGLAALSAGCTDNRDIYIPFAQCLTEKGAKMYGAYWCPHCAKQKERFGPNAFEKVTYIECDFRGRNAKPEVCKEKNIQGYPTWEFGDGSFVSGEMELSELSEKTQCTIPPPAEAKVEAGTEPPQK